MPGTTKPGDATDVRQLTHWEGEAASEIVSDAHFRNSGWIHETANSLPDTVIATRDPLATVALIIVD